MMGILAYLLLEEENRLERVRIIRQLRLERRMLRDASNPFIVDPEYFRLFYRLPTHVAVNLIEVLREFIDVRRRISKIPVHLQVLTALRFFAEGSYQKGVAQDYRHPMSQTSVSRSIDVVVNALLNLINRFIKFHQSTEERRRIRERFLDYIRIPGIIGIIDCFVVKFVRPKENEDAFFHHKHSHSMNVQIIADDNYKILNVRICPGSNNDRHVWNHSDAKIHLQSLRTDEAIVQQEGFYYILGDGGYTPSPILLTPLANADEGTPEAAYTSEHCRTRCKIEQLFGVLTNVWRCISRQRTLQYNPEKVAKIIYACCILHNFRRSYGIEDEIPVGRVNEDGPYNAVNYEGNYDAGINERQRLILEHYT